MADSEISRTLPAITRGKDNPQDGAPDILPRLIDRRNLLSVTARWLSARVEKTQDQRRAEGPTPVREMWPRWYAFHQRRMGATRLRQKLETDLLEETGGAAVVELRITGTDHPVSVRSFSDINRLRPLLNLDQLSQARAELRRRRKQWKEADQRLGYTAAVTLEHQLALQAGIAGRVMQITAPSSLTEVTAKLHCLIVMEDPGLRLERSPWPELRRLLKDLIRIGAQSSER